MKLSVLAGDYAVVRLPRDAEPPANIWASEFVTASRTKDELSLVVETRLAPPSSQTEAGFTAIKVEGPLDFSLTGILAKLAVPLAEAKISIFAISTFDTDYVLVRASDLTRTKEALVRGGFSF